ncbi:MAG: hypothetical protein JSS72_05905 [Armatimonadetes bacterium]|nr:hypothetical protein [Armatimonadota bacterium]
MLFPAITLLIALSPSQGSDPRRPAPIVRDPKADAVVARFDQFYKKHPIFSVKCTAVHQAIKGVGTGTLLVGPEGNAAFRLKWGDQDYGYYVNAGEGGLEIEYNSKIYQELNRKPIGIPQSIISTVPMYISPNVLILRNSQLIDVPGARLSYMRPDSIGGEPCDQVRSMYVGNDGAYKIVLSWINKEGKLLRYGFDYGRGIGFLDFKNYNFSPSFTAANFSCDIPAGSVPDSLPLIEEPLGVGRRAKEVKGPLQSQVQSGKVLVCFLDPTEPSQLSLVSAINSQLQARSIKPIWMSTSRKGAQGFTYDEEAMKSLVVAASPTFYYFEEGILRQVYLGKSAVSNKVLGTIFLPEEAKPRKGKGK